MLRPLKAALREQLQHGLNAIGIIQAGNPSCQM